MILDPVFGSYGAIALSLLLFKWVNSAALAYSKKLSVLHQDPDITSKKLQDFLVSLDRRFGSRWLPPLYLIALSFIAWPILKWRTLDPLHVLRPFYFFLSGIVVWKAISQKKDWFRNTHDWKEKIALTISWGAFYFYPSFMIAILFISIHMLRCWTPSLIPLLRTLQMFLSSLVAIAALYPFDYKVHHSAILFLTFVVFASHYLVSGISKLQLGGWMWNNRSDYLAASAHMWGWRRSLTMQGSPFFNRLQQIFILSVECAWLFVLFDDRFAQVLCVATIALHLNTFIKSGIFSWPLILAQIALWAVIPYVSPLFNSVNGILGVLAILIFPLMHKIWDRMGLWDAPFIGRIDWAVEGMSGKRYTLSSQCMGPYERFFGGSLPSFLIPHKIFHRFLGQVATRELREQIVATEGDRAKLESLQEQHGTLEKQEELVDAHDRFLFEYFSNYNKGRKRSSLVPWWFVRAPGFYFYRGIDPFRNQERIVKVIVSYREEFYDGKNFLLTRDEIIKEIVIPIKKFHL